MKITIELNNKQLSEESVELLKVFFDSIGLTEKDCRKMLFPLNCQVKVNKDGYNCSLKRGIGKIVGYGHEQGLVLVRWNKNKIRYSMASSLLERVT